MTKTKALIDVVVENSTKTAHPIGGTHWQDADGKLHRDDGPAHESTYVKAWYRHGQRHRDDGPALEYTNGSKVWYQHGLMHRIDGPALEYPDGLMDQYWVNDKRFTEEEFYKYVDHLTGEVLIPPGKKLTHD
jgi:hypothetical protein